MISGTVLVASDATGETGEKVVRAALVQFFGSEKVRVVMVHHVLDDGAVRKMVEQAKQQKALLVYTIVAPPLRALVRRLADEAEIHAYDLMSGLLLQMSSHFGEDPLYKAGLGHELDAEYFRRVEAVEFAVNNDDGREPRNLKRADIVLVGISRTSKTPTSQYIAHRGYKVANVPLVMGIPLPKEIEQIDPRRVFGLLVDPTTLVEIRRTRMKHLGMEPGNEYGDIRRVRQELEHCRKLFTAHPEWTLFDISGKAVEETASAILERYRERFEAGNGGGAKATSGSSATGGPSAAGGA
jgi:regulator of PEP synthase PpsR (kinase-PPPase family)